MEYWKQHFLAIIVEKDWIAKIFKNKRCFMYIFPVMSEWVYENNKLQKSKKANRQGSHFQVMGEDRRM